MSHKNSCGCGCGSNTQVFRGPKGAPGEGATVAVGTVRYGVVPAVTNVGTPTHAVLDFDLPNGDAILYRLRPELTPGTHLSLTMEHSTDGGETWKADEVLDSKVSLQFGKGLEVHQGTTNEVEYAFDLSVDTSELPDLVHTINHVAPDEHGNIDIAGKLYRATKTPEYMVDKIKISLDESSDGGKTWQHPSDTPYIQIRAGKGIGIIGGSLSSGVVSYEIYVREGSLPFVRTINHNAPDDFGNINIDHKLYRPSTEYFKRLHPERIGCALEYSDNDGTTWTRDSTDPVVYMEAGYGLSFTVIPEDNPTDYGVVLSIEPSKLKGFVRSVNHIEPDDDGNVDVAGQVLYRVGARKDSDHSDRLFFYVEKSEDGGQTWQSCETEYGHTTLLCKDGIMPHDWGDNTVGISISGKDVVKAVNGVKPTDASGAIWIPTLSSLTDDPDSESTALDGVGASPFMVHELFNRMDGGKVKTVNHIDPDEFGNIELPVKSVTDDPDSEGTAETGVAASPKMVKKYVEHHLGHKVVTLGPDPKTEWVYTHSLGYYPHVTVLDNRMRVVLADIEYPAPTEVKITFGSPRTGYLLIS